MTQPAPTLQFAQLRDRGRMKSAIAALISTVLLWISVILMSREYLPGSIVLTNALFGIALVATYSVCWSFALVVSNSPRLMFMRALATTLVVATCLLVLEVPAMLKLVDWTVVMRRLSSEGEDYGTAYVGDKELGFRRIPNMHWSGRPASDIEQAYWLPRSLATPINFTYDQWGYRNLTEMKQANIVLIGDSYVEGWYVSDEQTVASQLGHRLGQFVANLGVAGYGTMQELRVPKSDAVAKKPKVIAWFFFEGNDLYDDQTFENILAAAPPGPEETTPQSKGLIQRASLDKILAWLNEWKQRSFALNAFRFIRVLSDPIVPNRAPYWALRPREDGSSKRIYFFSYAAVPWTEYEESRWEKTKQTFRDGIRAARANGAAIILIYVPIKFRVYRDLIKIPPGSPLKSLGRMEIFATEFHGILQNCIRALPRSNRPLAASCSRGRRYLSSQRYTLELRGECRGCSRTRTLHAHPPLDVATLANAYSLKADAGRPEALILPRPNMRRIGRFRVRPRWHRSPGGAKANGGTICYHRCQMPRMHGLSLLQRTAGRRAKCIYHHRIR